MPKRLTITVPHDLGAAEVRRRIDLHMDWAFPPPGGGEDPGRGRGLGRQSPRLLGQRLRAEGARRDPGGG
ncbi:hypothetical protein ACU4GA_23700 [Methylobacterium oryzae CBMB20]